MKKFILSLSGAFALASVAYAGSDTYSSKDTKQTAPAPCPEWYADSEWTIGISGVYAPTTNEYREDTYLGVDHAWGGAIDVKYFFRRYFGVGVQGFGLSLDQDNNINNFGDDDSNNDFAGGVLGTFTFRYPIPCSRFAPFGWVGAGGIFGGGADGDRFFDDDDDIFLGDDEGEQDGRFMAQYGAGFEVRFTPRIGLTHDISYNHVEGGENDFIQVRAGLNFAF
jgi:hypothetical protein